MKDTRAIKGKQGENAVAQYLRNQGYTIRAHNFTKQYGEVDLIAHKNDTLVFVEVKTRTNPLVDPAEVISIHKQKRITKAAKAYIAHSAHTDDFVYRFDVALVEEHNNDFHIRYIENAFYAFE